MMVGAKDPYMIELDRVWLAQAAALSPEQVARYISVRGFGGNHQGHARRFDEQGNTMRKRIIEPIQRDSGSQGDKWLNLEMLAEVEVTSEDPAHPIERALIPGQATGWRASGPGTQIIRLVFTHPQALKLVSLRFVEDLVERTQEYVLRWSPDGGKPLKEIVRQQWNFGPHGATAEVENHQVDLPAVTVLELSINPDIAGKPAIASLQAMQLA
jgi:hypothetical protein